VTTWARKVQIMKLSNEEKNLVKSFESGEWISSKRLVSDRKQLAQYAKTALRKDKRVNIRISENDLVQLQRKAVQDGLPYQTLISSVLHKFLNGRLVEREAE
jgi:predicted DNA binding CopG/RHH family protein